MLGEEKVRDLLDEQRIAAIQARLAQGAERREARRRVRRMQELVHFLAPALPPFRLAYKVGAEKVLAAYRQNQERLGLAS